jgi:class 3 adenylate cyclase
MPHGGDFIERKVLSPLIAMIQASQTVGIRTWIDIAWPDSTPEFRRSTVRRLRSHCSVDVLASYVGMFGTLNISDELASIESPSLIVQPTPAAPWQLTAARAFAAAIPGGRFTTTDARDEHVTLFQQHVEVMRSFLADDDLLSVSPESSGAHETAIILFADIADSTAITERIGDAAFHTKSEQLHRALREALASSGGRVVEGRVLGDGVMAVFDAAKDAIAAASACHTAAETCDLQLHVGIHAGDVIRDANDVHGGAVNIAARVAAASAAAETLVSDVVRALARTSAGVTFEDRGEFAPKGIEEPQRLWRVADGGQSR